MHGHSVPGGSMDEVHAVNESGTQVRVPLGLMTLFFPRVSVRKGFGFRTISLCTAAVLLVPFAKAQSYVQLSRVSMRTTAASCIHAADRFETPPRSTTDDRVVVATLGNPPPAPDRQPETNTIQLSCSF